MNNAPNNATLATREQIIAHIEEFNKQNPVVLYMKGTPDFPQCGFSSQVVQLLKACGLKDFAYVNVLEAPEVRQTIKEYSNWPTFPQLYIKGELVGGCDIVTEMYEDGQLASMLDQA